ncbi:MAG: phosphohistidine phosphatase SixA [Solirubrobacteraceae bacterium]
MARQLWLLRHGEAEPHGTREDAERRLTERGVGQAHAAGIALQRLQVSFDAALFSPKTRARRTAELAAEHWSPQQRELLSVHPPLAGDFDARQALAELAALPADGRLLIVGHEPDLSGVVADLTGARPGLKKGGLAGLRLESAAGGELVVLLRPRELALIAGGLGGAGGIGGGPVDGD